MLIVNRLPAGAGVGRWVWEMRMGVMAANAMTNGYEVFAEPIDKENYNEFRPHTPTDNGQRITDNG
jgi:hypothetical protein